MAISPGEAIQRLERFQTRISNPRTFYREVRLDWTQTARRIVEQTMVALAPSSIDPEEWQAKIVEISARVASQFIEDEEMGLVLTIAPRVGAENVDAASFAVGNLSINDVEEWVRAGREKSSEGEPGKNIREIDLGKSDLQIAWRVMYALKLRKPGWERLMEVLREFVGLHAEDLAEQMYAGLLQSWMEHFVVRAPADFRGYVARLVRAI